MFKQRWACAAVQRRRALRSGAAGRGPGLRAVHRRAVRGVPQRGRDRPAEPGADRAAGGVRSGPGAGRGHRADPDHRRRGRHPVPAGPGRRQPARAAGADAGARSTWVAGGHDGELSVDALVGRPDRLVRPLPKADGSIARHRPSRCWCPRRSLVGRGRAPRPGDPGRSGVPGPRSRSDRPVGLALAGDRAAGARPAGRRPAALTNLPGDRAGAWPVRPASPATPSACCPDSRRLFTTEPLADPADPGRQRPGRPGGHLQPGARRPCSPRCGTSARTSSAPRTGGPRPGPSSAVLPQLAWPRSG